MNSLVAEAKKKGPLGMPLGIWAGFVLVVGYLAYRWWSGRSSSANNANVTGTATPTSPDVIVQSVPGQSPAPTPPVDPKKTPTKKLKHHKHTKKSHRHHHTPHDHKQGTHHEHRGTHKTGEPAPHEKKRHSSNEKAHRTTRNIPHRPHETPSEKRAANRRSVAAAQHHHNQRQIPGPVKEPQGEHSRTHRAKEPPRKRDHGRGRR